MATEFPKFFKISPSWITCYAQPCSVRDVITNLMTTLIQDIPALENQNFLSYFLNQEQNHEALIGDGLAFFHGYGQDIPKTLLAVSRFLQPISLWNGTVHTIFIIISPSGIPGQHLAALAQLSQLFVAPKSRAAWEQSHTSEEVFNLLQGKQIDHHQQ